MPVSYTHLDVYKRQVWEDFVMSMKKTTVGILTSIIVVSAGTVSVFAAGQAKGRNFTDVDGNGICNNAKVVCSYVDEDQNILNQQQKSASISIHLWSWNLIDLIVCSQWKVNDQIQSKEVLNLSLIHI